MTIHRITFITPLFSKGSYEDHPEIRPPSIRGQLHWWFRALGGSYGDEKTIFGSVHGKPVHASKVVVRVTGISDGEGEKARTGEADTLPHKHGGAASPKAAFERGTTFDLIISERLGGLQEVHRSAFRRALEAWLLAGTLGLRSTRGGGSFVWQAASGDAFVMPESLEAYRVRLRDVFGNAKLRHFVLEDAYQSAEEARACVSDTLGGRTDTAGTGDLSLLRNPLGTIARPRKTSPLRFRIVRLSSGYHVVAVWDDRSNVTGNQPGDFEAVVKLLAKREKPIGQALVRELQR